ncbi:hypothetical protein KAH94_00080 [bacterium]|nr:hypothetical protein [bacterium]
MKYVYFLQWILFIVGAFGPFSSFCQIAPSFGKTNFIVDVQSDDVRVQSRSKLLKKKLKFTSQPQKIMKAFFSPDDDVRSVLLDLIACEQKSIRIAAFLLTDDAVAKALLDAKARGVLVEVVADKLCCYSRHGKIKMLHRQGLQSFIYSGQKKNNHMSNIMHDKFVIFEKNIFDKSLLWTGSFNFTRSAWLNNQENVLLLDDLEIISCYKKQFEVIKKRCIKYETTLFNKSEKKLAKKKALEKSANKTTSKTVPSTTKIIGVAS